MAAGRGVTVPRERNRKSESESESKGDRQARGPFHVLLVLMVALLLTIACLIGWNACSRFERASDRSPDASQRVAHPEPATSA
jgi:hypothetical protein